MEHTLQSKANIDNIIKIINAPFVPTLDKYYLPTDSLIYANFTVTLNSTTLVHIPELKLALGGLYAFTGEAGCGKSTTLIATNDNIFPPLKSTGSVTYPLIDGHKPQIVFLTQKPYLLPEYLGPSLLETTYFPQILPEDPQVLEEVITLVIKMFTEFKLRGFDPQQKTPAEMRSYLLGTDFKLSGGETSKVTIISAILQQPDILLLDETLQNLDPQSRINVLHLLIKHLPKALKIIVAHEDIISAAYTKHIHFTNKTIVQYNTPSTNFIDYELPSAAEQSFYPELEQTQSHDCTGDSTCLLS